ncbi:MAG: hypothetical protein EOM65_16075 [Synergistales bacterium]|nr:hypothetical protein [Synergistales bacterium]
MLAAPEISRDGEWHEVEAEITVPDGAHGVVRPITGMDATHDPAPGRVDIRDIMLGMDDVDRMLPLSRYLKSLVRPGIQRCLYNREDLQWAATTFTVGENPMGMATRAQ